MGQETLAIETRASFEYGDNTWNEECDNDASADEDTEPDIVIVKVKRSHTFIIHDDDKRTFIMYNEFDWNDDRYHSDNNFVTDSEEDERGRFVRIITDGEERNSRIIKESDKTERGDDDYTGDSKNDDYESDSTIIYEYNHDLNDETEDNENNQINQQPLSLIDENKEDNYGKIGREPAIVHEQLDNKTDVNDEDDSDDTIIYEYHCDQDDVAGKTVVAKPESIGNGTVRGKGAISTDGDNYADEEGSEYDVNSHKNRTPADEDLKLTEVDTTNIEQEFSALSHIGNGDG